MDTTYYTTVDFSSTVFEDNNVSTYQDYWYIFQAKTNSGYLSYYSNKIFANPHDTILRVPSQFQTIQAALDTAISGDFIFVEDGVYKENLLWPNQDNITLRSTSRDSCTIDGSIYDTASCVVISNNQKGVVIDGFSIKNGYGYRTSSNTQNSYGGAVFIGANVEAKVTNCIFSENVGRIGSVFHVDGKLELSYSIIRNNSNPNTGSSDHLGTIYADGYSNLSIHHNLFYNNSSNFYINSNNQVS